MSDLLTRIDLAPGALALSQRVIDANGNEWIVWFSYLYKNGMRVGDAFHSTAQEYLDEVERRLTMQKTKFLSVPDAALRFDTKQPARLNSFGYRQCATRPKPRGRKR